MCRYIIVALYRVLYGYFFHFGVLGFLLQALVQTDQAGEGTGEEASDKIGPADDEAAGLSSASKGGTL